MVRYTFSKEILHRLKARKGSLYPYSSRHIHAREIATSTGTAEVYPLMVRLMQFANGFVYYAPRDVKEIEFHGFMLPVELFESSPVEV